MLNYRKTYFDPAKLPRFQRVDSAQREDWAYAASPGAQGQQADEVFVFAQEAVLAVNIALATKRPLLVVGEPGSGKTSLGRFASSALGRIFYRHTVSSRTQSSDLLSAFDAVRRLANAQAGEPDLDPRHYVVPGALWWAMSPRTARQRGLVEIESRRQRIDPGLPPLATAQAGPAEAGSRAALLVDEIDKADPDVPNDLLEALDERRFTVPETNDVITSERDDLLVIFTTNGEREMPPAFLRRCVTLELPPPTRDWLVDIARRRHGAADAPLFERIAAATMEARKAARDESRRPPGTSEYLDAVSACLGLAVDRSAAAQQALLDLVTEATLGKRSVQRGAGD